MGEEAIERRQSARIAKRTATTCRVPASPRRAVLHDLSYHGCKLELAEGVFELGATVSLELGDGTQARGQVVWTACRTAGVRFERPIRQASAIYVGLEEAPEIVEPEPVPQIEQLGMIRHWFRRLTGTFVPG